MAVITPFIRRCETCSVNLWQLRDDRRAGAKYPGAPSRRRPYSISFTSRATRRPMACDVLRGLAKEMLMRNLLFTTLLAAAALSGCKTRSSETAADNTARNERDRTATPTADN